MGKTPVELSREELRKAAAAFLALPAGAHVRVRTREGVSIEGSYLPVVADLFCVAPRQPFLWPMGARPSLSMTFDEVAEASHRRWRIGAVLGIAAAVCLVCGLGGAVAAHLPQTGMWRDGAILGVLGGGVLAAFLMWLLQDWGRLRRWQVVFTGADRA